MQPCDFDTLDFFSRKLILRANDRIILTLLHLPQKPLSSKNRRLVKECKANANQI